MQFGKGNLFSTKNQISRNEMQGKSDNYNKYACVTYVQKDF